MPAALPRPRRVAVVGSGASGLLVALHLLRGPAATAVTLVERAHAGGVAYGTHDPAHRLNVAAIGMSAFPDAPGDLVAWAAAHGFVGDPEAFLPRIAYARYLADRLAAAEAAPAHPGSSLGRRRGEVVGLVRADATWRLRLAGGDALDADAVVLATGHGPPVDPLAALGGAALDAARYARDAWAPGALDGLRPTDDVLVLGAGLTFVDLVLSRHGAGATGRTIGLSRRGLLPLSHRRDGAGPPRPVDVASVLAAPTLRARLAAVRRLAADETARGGDWRDVIAALRAGTPALWATLSPADRARFLRHVRTFWDVHRHRTAPDVADVVARARDAGRVAVLAGRVVAAAPTPRGVAVTWRPRGRAATARLEVARVVNATGTSLDLRRPTEPLFADLAAAGAYRADPLGLGLATADDGAVLYAAGRAHDALFAIGPLRMGDRWESTAVPELRVQAAALAARLAR
ncbi:MAG: FAD/NAD(P)-binding protein [Planctomycetia bacterium]|nr:FAD/NAD(P)-binding protein [Planctomycetia bacterium]